MNTDDDKLERQIALVKKFYPDRDSLWAFFDTFGIYDFILGCMKDNRIDNKVNKYFGKRNVGLYMWEVFVMIEYVSTYNKVQKSESEKEKFNEFEEQFKNI